MIRLDELVLWSVDPAGSERFLQGVMPQVAIPPPLSGLARVRYRHRALRPTTAAAGVATPSGSDGFWKYSVFADSIDELRGEVESGEWIGSDGIDPGTAAADVAAVEVTDPVQFGDIGYLCHLHEPGGNEIELLQRSFAPPRAAPSIGGHSGPATLGLITLRVADAVATIRLLADGLGMSHLVSMKVNEHRPDGFGLEFLAWTADEPPSQDRFDVSNREWLYQRPYTVIELQHGPGLGLIHHAADGPGLAHIGAVSDDLDAVRTRLEAVGESWSRLDSHAVDQAMLVTTPDGHDIRIDRAP